MITEWVPACSYTPDASLNAVKTRVGDMDYWTYDVCAAQDYTGHTIATCEDTYAPSDPSSMQNWLNSQFTDVGLDGYKMVGGSADQVHLEKDGEKFVMCPILSTAISQQTETDTQLSHAYANNGAGYIMARVNNFEEESINKVFIPRAAQGTTTFARKIDLDNALIEALQHSKINPDFASNIARTAYRKEKGDS